MLEKFGSGWSIGPSDSSDVEDGTIEFLILMGQWQRDGERGSAVVDTRIEDGLPVVVLQLEAYDGPEAAVELTVDALGGLVGIFQVNDYQPERVRLLVLPADTEAHEAGLAGRIEAPWAREWCESEQDDAAFERLASRVEGTFDVVDVEEVDPTA